MVYSQEVKWKNFQSPEGRFYVDVPEVEWIDESKPAETAVGEVFIHSMIWDQSDQAEPIVYRIMFYDYPGGTIHQDSVELRKAILESTVSATLEKTEGTLVYQDEQSSLLDLSAIWRIQLPDNQGIVKSKIGMKDDRIYILSAISLQAVGTPRGIDRFLDSFRVY